jgi:hypothetical protein
MGIDLELVVVAACKSEFVGRMFQNAGAHHVICIREGAEILDKSVLIFTKNFYKQIFKGDMICDAFEKAKAAVGIQVNIGSENMFKMLVREELTQIKSHGARKMAHSCTEYGPLDRG